MNKYDMTAPDVAEFERHCEYIGNGEQLGTLKKVKDFWLYAIEIAKNNYEARDYIGDLTINATWRSFIFKNGGVDPSDFERLNKAYERLIFLDHVGDSPFPEKETNKQFSDRIWDEFEKLVNAVPEKQTILRYTNNNVQANK